jgi:hypothetical protein
LSGRHAHTVELRHRIRYRLDNVLARGMWASLVALGVVTFAVLAVSSVLLTVFGVTLAGSENQSWIEDFWQTMLRVLDPGTMADDVGWGRRLLALGVTLFGVLVAGTLIGIIASGVEARIERMRRGRSTVVEANHLVVLGESPRVGSVIQQLVLANAGRGGTTIVVLAKRDPSELNEEVRAVVRDLRGSRLVFRDGDPTSRFDLGLVRLDQARAVIVMSGDGAEADADAVKSMLAIGAELGGFDRVRTVVELDDPIVGERIARSCGGQVYPMVTTQGITRTAAFALRQPGLRQIIEELLDFGGCDLHVDHRPEVTGLAFGSIVHLYGNASPIGRVRADGAVELAPPPDVVMEPTDRLILIADHLETLDVVPASRRGEPVRWDPTARVDAPTPRSQHLLVIGWNSFGARLLADWATFTAPDSTVEVVVDPTVCDVGSIAIHGLDRQSMTVSTAPWAPSAVDERVTTILLLGYSDRLSAGDADTRTLLDLLALRRQLRSSGREPPHVSVQLLDTANRSLLDPDDDDDVISEEIGSRFLAQLAEYPERRDVLLALYAAHGAAIRLVPAGQLGLVGTVVAADIVTASYHAGLMAFGWRRRTAAGTEMTLNPRRDQVVELDHNDQIVVIG